MFHISYAVWFRHSANKTWNSFVFSLYSVFVFMDINIHITKNTYLGIVYRKDIFSRFFRWHSTNQEDPALKDILTFVHYINQDHDPILNNNTFKNNTKKGVFTHCRHVPVQCSKIHNQWCKHLLNADWLTSRIE